MKVKGDCGWVNTEDVKSPRCYSYQNSTWTYPLRKLLWATVLRQQLNMCQGYLGKNWNVWLLDKVWRISSLPNRSADGWHCSFVEPSHLLACRHRWLSYLIINLINTSHSVLVCPVSLAEQLQAQLSYFSPDVTSSQASFFSLSTHRATNFPFCISFIPLINSIVMICLSLS